MANFLNADKSWVGGGFLGQVEEEKNLVSEWSLVGELGRVSYGRGGLVGWAGGWKISKNSAEASCLGEKKHLGTVSYVRDQNKKDTPVGEEKAWFCL